MSMIVVAIATYTFHLTGIVKNTTVKPAEYQIAIGNWEFSFRSQFYVRVCIYMCVFVYLCVSVQTLKS